MSPQRNSLNISALGLLAQSGRPLSFGTDLTVHEIVISMVNQPSVRFSELEGVTSVVDCVKCVPTLA